MEESTCLILIGLTVWESTQEVLVGQLQPTSHLFHTRRYRNSTTIRTATRPLTVTVPTQELA